MKESNQDLDVDERQEAIKELGQIGPAAAPTVFVLLQIALLPDEHEGVRVSAAIALGEIVPAAAPLVRASAAYALSNPQIVPAAKDAVPALITALEDENVYVRHLATNTLGQIGSAAKDAVPALITALGDENENVRFTAVHALGQIGPAAAPAVPALITAFSSGDENLHVRISAGMALGQIGPAAKDAVPELEKLLSDKNRYVRETAKEAIEKIQNKDK